ncbi:MAG: flavin reductase family protein [Thermoleophilia bacterium]|nr:flavin reductase family protein [Thermoleophilia bacterium]
MFYRPCDGHGLRLDPFNAIVVPRPIGWVSSVDRDGLVNLAPFSFFNAVAYRPPQVAFSATGPHALGGAKDSLRNIEETGEFAVNLASWPLREAVNATSAPAPHGTDEFELAGLTKAPARIVRVPLVAESPAQLECTLVEVVRLRATDPARPNTLVVGEVVGVHISDDAIAGGALDTRRLEPIARLGYDEYSRLGEVFSMTRPGWP